jgi:uncharacterized protein
MNSFEEKNRFGIYDKTFLFMLETFKSFTEIEHVIIYGSRAIGNYKKGSDIDLAIVGEKVDLHTVNKLSVKLNEELPVPYYFDVLDYNSLSNQELKKHIDQEGKFLYSRNSSSPSQ